MDTIWGRGLKWPLEADSAGRLVMTEGPDRLWDTIALLLDTPRGSAPMDPEFGVDLELYDPVNDAALVGHEIARAIQRSEPRVKDIQVEILEANANTGDLKIRVTVTPIDSQVPLNRVLGAYGLKTA